MTSDVLIELTADDADPAVAAESPISLVPAAERRLQGAEHTFLLTRTGRLLGRLSCWWTATPHFEEHRIGVIGHYAAVDEESGCRVLSEACSLLARQGCRLAVGPMDGNTWRRYRFIVERGHEPPFVLEPDNPDDWPHHWRAAGFSTLATYASAVNEQLQCQDLRTAAALARLKDRGITIRSLDVERADAELEAIFELSLRSFSDNFLYTPIAREEFTAQYRRILPHVRPELVLIGEQDAELIGYLFAMPDVMQAVRGAPVDTIVLKTLAVAPAVRGLGLGGVLLDSAQREAYRLGFRRAIHALFHEQNLSARISARYATPMRRYALFSRAVP